MKHAVARCMMAIMILALLAVPGRLAAAKGASRYVAIDLGTLPGGYESQACCITGRGMVAGFASNGTLDPFSIFGWGTQVRSFVWQNGTMRDIGTLGGPDAVMTLMNGSGQITGVSYTSATPNAATGICTLDLFLWQNGKMRDLGGLGGTVSNIQGNADVLNSRGEVVGQS